MLPVRYNKTDAATALAKVKACSYVKDACVVGKLALSDIDSHDIDILVTLNTETPFSSMTEEQKQNFLADMAEDIPADIGIKSGTQVYKMRSTESGAIQGMTAPLYTHVIWTTTDNYKIDLWFSFDTVLTPNHVYYSNIPWRQALGV